MGNCRAGLLAEKKQLMPVKKIFICIDWFDPAYKAGGPVQSCKNLVAALHQDFSFYIFTSDRDEGDTEPFSNIVFNQWITYAPNVQVYYAQGKTDIKALVKTVNPDIVYCNSMYSYPFTIKPLMAVRRLKPAPAIVLAPRGMLQEGAMRFKSTKKKIFLSAMRFLRWERNIHFHATDKQEEKDIRKHFPRAKSIFVASNFPAQGSPAWQPAVKENNVLNCVFLSRIVPKKNLLFLIQCINNIPAEYKITLEIWGSGEDVQYLEQCKAAAANAPAHITITFKGAVRNDLLGEVYKNAHLFALPTLGENFGHVIFEAMQHGVPVVISNRTPWNNLTEGHCGYVLSLDDPAEWTRTINSFAAMEQQEFNKWSKSVWAFAGNYKKLSDPKPQYIQVFGEIIQ